MYTFVLLYTCYVCFVQIEDAISKLLSTIAILKDFPSRKFSRVMIAHFFVFWYCSAMHPFRPTIPQIRSAMHPFRPTVQAEGAKGSCSLEGNKEKLSQNNEVNSFCKA